MAELDHCKKEQSMSSMPEGMVPFVVYGYPMMGNMPAMPMCRMGAMEDRCSRYGMMPQCFPQMNVMNPVFFKPYQRPGCGCGVSDLEDE